MDALKQAETYVYEPVNEFELTVPEHAISTAMYKLAAIPATFAEPIFNNDSYQLTGSLPVAKTEHFKRMLHSFTEGRYIYNEACWFHKRLRLPSLLENVLIIIR